VVSRSIATAASIEDAMNVVSDVTGDKSIAQISAEIPIPSPPEMTPEIKSCVSNVIGQEESNDFNVTLGGLPNFSKMSATEISPSEFQLIVDCLPWVHLLRSPIRLVANDRQSLFEDDVIEKAYMVGQSVRNSVVVIETPTGNGTGWLMSDYGHIMTNQHVVEGRDSVTVRLLDGRRFEGPIIGQTTSPDVAVIKIDPPSGMVPLSVGTTTDLKAGDPLVVVGHPGIMGYWIATIGTFKKFENVIGDESIEWEGLITTVPGKQGSSGSPMFNLDGQVVGLVYGGQSLEPRDKNDPPKVASLEVREYFMPESLELVVSIEEAMKRAVDWVK
jgi:S1-C subfamily serine protease